MSASVSVRENVCVCVREINRPGCRTRAVSEPDEGRIPPLCFRVAAQAECDGIGAEVCEV